MISAAFCFPECSEWPRGSVSKTKIATYRQCPESFAFKYALKVPPEVAAAADIFGRAMHEAVALYYRGVKQGLVLQLADLVAEFNRCWSLGLEAAAAPIRYATGYDAAAMAALGRALLEIFLRDVRPRQVLAVEQRFAVPLGDATLIGILDLVELDQDGDAIVVELKTACGRMSDRQADIQLDGKVYAFALDRLGLRKPGEDTLVRYDVLIKRKRPALSSTYAPQAEAAIQSFTNWIRPVLDGIRRGRFYRRPGWYCAYCPWARACQEKKSMSLPGGAVRQSLAGSGALSNNPAFRMRNPRGGGFFE